VHAVRSSEHFAALLAAAGDALVVVDFFATWCGPCKRIAPAYAAAAAAAGASVRFLKVDCDAASDVAAREGIRAFPTFKVLFRAKVLEAWEGADMDRVAAAVARHGEAVEDILTAEAIAESAE
jgi:thioredoxin-like negative regulator of GroEL